MCSEHSACKWGVYGNDAGKRIRFYIDNNRWDFSQKLVYFYFKLLFIFSCTCGDDRKCVVAEENLSMAAFVYRCISDNPTTTSTTESSDAA